MQNERTGMMEAARSTIILAAPWTLIEKGLLATICAATLFFAVITPPFQAPDENQHYFKALNLSQGGIFAEKRKDAIGADLPVAGVALHVVDFPTEGPAVARRFDSASLALALRADTGRKGSTFAPFPNVASYAPTLYLPGAAGLWIGDRIGLPRLGSFYLGRFVNGLTGIALLIAALRLLPFGRFALLATGLLPTFAYQTGSLSPDAVINGLGFLGLAIALRIGFGTRGAVETTALFVTAPLLALAKGVYLPLMAAGLRWPDRGRDIRPWVILGAMLLGAVAFVAWMHMSGGSQALYHIQSRKTGETMMTAPLADQLHVILADPMGYAHILASSVIERAPVYLLQSVGRFGWNAILLPLLAYPLAMLMIGAGVMSGTGVRFGLVQRLWWITVALGVALLIETAMYLTGTPLGADYIQGTQGRYFLPVLPLVLIALSPARLSLAHGSRRAPRILAATGGLLLMIAAVSAFDAFWVHGFITSDGMPPHRSITSALILPSPRW